MVATDAFARMFKPRFFSRYRACAAPLQMYCTRGAGTTLCRA
jgi:hypothetical protein